MSEPVEDAPNIGKELGRRLREVGISTRAELERVGDSRAFVRLLSRFPEDACTHTRLALAGAVRNVRWSQLPRELREELKKEVP